MAVFHESPPPYLPALLRAHGAHSLAYALCQPRLAYFGDDHRGVLAFRRSLGQCVVLGDPLAPEEGRAALLDAFLRRAPRAVFMQIGAPVAALLRDRGHSVSPVGVENVVDLATFTLSGSRKADLRHYRNRAREGGVEVEEAQDCAELRTELSEVSRAWLAAKRWSKREREFLVRPFVPSPEEDVRLFVGRQSGRAVGFVILDPLQRAAGTFGYTLSILRHLPSAPEGTVDLINLHAIEMLRREGQQCFDLGISPFRRIEELAAEHGRGARAAYWHFLALRKWANPVYHFQGICFHKSRYRAREVPVFVALRGMRGLFALYAAAHACRMM